MKELLALGARLCELSYKEPAWIIAGLDELDLNYFQWVENKETDCQAYICADETRVFIVIRGTEFDNWEDWKTNLDCELLGGYYGNSHRGFMTDAVSIVHDITEDLLKHTIKNKKIYVLGHSQGAGVGKQLTLLLLRFGYDISASVGYGEPRSVDKETAGKLDELFPEVFHRVVNNCDLVTRIPTRFMGYGHFGKLHYYKENGEYTTDISAWRRFLDRMAGRVADIGKPGLDTLKDHDVREYMRVIG